MRIKVRIKFMEDCLGTIPKNAEVYSTWVELNRAKREGEDAPELTEEKSWTGFPTDDQGLHLYNYHIKGFLKHAASVNPDITGMKKKSGETISGQMMRGRLDDQVFVFPRKIYFQPNKAQPDGFLERSLRARTMQGDRITLVRSDTVKAGTEMEFEILIIPNSKITLEAIKAWLEYGELLGIGQWRNSSWGSFKTISFKATA